MTASIPETRQVWGVRPHRGDERAIIIALMVLYYGTQHIDVIVKLHERSDWYDPTVMEALEVVIGFEEAIETQEVKLEDLTTSMTLADDVTCEDGTMLVGKGQEVSSSLCQRLRNFARKPKINEPIRVLVRTDLHSPVTAQM